MNAEQLLVQTYAIDTISRELGVDAATAKAGAAALLPQILSGFQQPAAAPQAAIGGGLGGLIGTIRGLGGGGLLDNVTSSQPTEVDKGNQILGQIFGSKDESRAVAAEAAAQTGVEPSLLKKMLPILAMIVAGYVMKQAGQGGGGGGGRRRLEATRSAGCSGDRRRRPVRKASLSRPRRSSRATYWVS